MEHLQRALLVADGRELVGAFERILGFLCEGRVSVCVCVLRCATSARWRGGAGLSPLTRRRREGSPADAPAVRSAVTAVPTRPRIISRTALRRAIGPRTPGAHVKILVSHGQRGEPRCTSLAARRCASVRNSKFMAARVGWRPLVGPQRALLEAKTPRSLAIEAKS